MRSTRTWMLAAAVAAMPLAACSKAETDEGQQVSGDVSGSTLAAAIANESNLSVVSQTLNEAGLSAALDGPASYTVLAPVDEAFAAASGDAVDLANPEGRAIMVAILRDHILPGHLTPESVRAAIERRGGPVEMRTLGEGTVRFALDGEELSIVGQGDTRSMPAGSPILAGNGVVIPVKQLLKPLPRPVSNPG